MTKELFYKILIDNLYDGVYFVDRDRRITYWNKSAERLTGYPNTRVVGTFCHDNLLNHVTENGKHLCQDGCPLHATMQDGRPREAEVYLRHADGHRIPVLVRTSPIHDESQNIIGAVELFSNNKSLFKMKRRVDQLEHSILVDPLTGIGNREYAELKIISALGEYRLQALSFALLFLDIDHFKSVNDMHGHNAGDKVLKNTANTLKHNLRGSDKCGRWGGEEFIVIVFEVDQIELESVADKLRSLIETSVISIQGQDLHVTVSIGATLVAQDDTLETLVHRADSLMYKSKTEGRNRVSFG